MRFSAVRKQYGDFHAISETTLDIKAGEFVSLLGPSGSGKTTLLMIAAGFETPSAGRILLDSIDVTDLPANKRDIGMVFQRYALFPHMTVAENIAFPLRMRGLSRSRIAEEVASALALVQLSGLQDRKPNQLSGGQQQRVAVARAIIFKPKLILMDEPLGALDRKLRQQLQFEIKQLQTRLGATVIFVTHDQEEAMTMSDRVAVLNHGRVCQFDTPERLYKNPATSFVAKFVGEMNFVRGTVATIRDNRRVDVLVDGVTFDIKVEGTPTPEAGAMVAIAIRPEKLFRISVPQTGQGLLARVVQTVFQGMHRIVIAESMDSSARLVFYEKSDRSGLAAGDQICLAWEPHDARLYLDHSA